MKLDRADFLESGYRTPAKSSPDPRTPGSSRVRRNPAGADSVSSDPRGKIPVIEPELLSNSENIGDDYFEEQV